MGKKESMGRAVNVTSEYGGDKAELFFNRLDNGLKAREAEPPAHSEYYRQRGIHRTGS